MDTDVQQLLRDTLEEHGCKIVTKAGIWYITTRGGD